jgi:hypothetical protein
VILLTGANVPQARPVWARLKAGKQAMAAPRYATRRSDKILIDFHHACDQRDIEGAA